MKRDVFICHASEDKESVINPLINPLANIGVSYWYDKENIFLGDSITEKVNEVF